MKYNIMMIYCKKNAPINVSIGLLSEGRSSGEDEAQRSKAVGLYGHHCLRLQHGEILGPSAQHSHPCHGKHQRKWSLFPSFIVRNIRKRSLFLSFKTNSHPCNGKHQKTVIVSFFQDKQSPLQWQTLENGHCFFLSRQQSTSPYLIQQTIQTLTINDDRYIPLVKRQIMSRNDR